MSSYKGVYWHKNKWLVRISNNGRQLIVGRYDSEEEAARAYDLNARMLHGNNADLNFPEENGMADQKFKTSWAPVPKDWEKLQHHPYACIVEFGAGINIDGVVLHMRQFGYDQGEPITLWRESPKHPFRILAGRHRHHCAIEAGVTPSFCILEGDDSIAKAFALKDILRRHLTESQRAMIAAALANMKQGQKTSDKPDSPIGEGDKTCSKSREEVAKDLNVSERALDRAKKVTSSGTPTLKQAVMEETISLSDAAAVADEPVAVQEKAVQDVKDGKERTASAAAAKNPSSNGHKNGTVTFDDRKVTDSIGKLVRLFNDRANAMSQQKSPQYKDVREKMEAVITAWDRWQLAQEKR